MPIQEAAPSSVGVRRMRVCHVMSADLWAGAEVQLATLTSYLMSCADVDLFVILLNDGHLARRFEAAGHERGDCRTSVAMVPFRS